MQTNGDAQQEKDFNEPEEENYFSEEESFIVAGFGEIELEAKESIGAESKMKEKSTHVEEHIPNQRGGTKRHGDRGEDLATKYPGLENGQYS